MNKILHITASARYEDSVSRKLSNRLADRFKQNNYQVIERDLNKGENFAQSATHAAAGMKYNNLDKKYQDLSELADKLIDEIKQSDKIILSLPMYNFAAPATFKAWADMVAKAGVTFKYTDKGPIGLLENKKLYLIYASGGTKVGSDIDFLSPWVKHFFKFIGITDIEIISSVGMSADDKIEEAIKKIDNIAISN